MDRHLDLYRSLGRHQVKYLVIGGTAAIVYGVPRTTRDIDLLIDATVENAQSLLDALMDVKCGTACLTTAKAIIEHEISIFDDYMRIDVLTKAKGVDFAEVWERRNAVSIDGVEVDFIRLDDLIDSKRAAGRPGDIEDVGALECIRRRTHGGRGPE